MARRYWRKFSLSTFYRAERMRTLLACALGRQAAADHFGAPCAICRHPDPTQADVKRTMTTGAVLIDLDARTMHVANGPPCSNEYVPFAV